MAYISGLYVGSVFVIAICVIVIITSNRLTASKKKRRISEKEAFKRLAERYPSRPEEIEFILDYYFAKGPTSIKGMDI